MTHDRWIDAAVYALLILLPLSALGTRRVSFTRVLSMALTWALIFTAGYLVVTRTDWLPQLADYAGDQEVGGGETRIRMAPDGHFWAKVTINGVKRRMLIDSGATVTALSTDTADAAGIKLTDPFPAILRTANGDIAARSARAARVTVGNVTARNLSVVVSPAFGETDVIGMNFLSRLHGWRVEGHTLILSPNQKRT